MRIPEEDIGKYKQSHSRAIHPLEIIIYGAIAVFLGNVLFTASALYLVGASIDSFNKQFSSTTNEQVNAVSNAAFQQQIKTQRAEIERLQAQLISNTQHRIQQQNEENKVRQEAEQQKRIQEAQAAQRNLDTCHFWQNQYQKDKEQKSKDYMNEACRKVYPGFVAR